MELILFWLFLALLVAFFASSRGHSGVIAFIMAVLLSPLIWFIIELVRSPNRQAAEAQAIESGDMKKCPACAELIKREAAKCRYCGEELPAESGLPPNTIGR